MWGYPRHEMTASEPERERAGNNTASPLWTSASKTGRISIYQSSPCPVIEPTTKATTTSILSPFRIRKLCYISTLRLLSQPWCFSYWGTSGSFLGFLATHYSHSISHLPTWLQSNFPLGQTIWKSQWERRKQAEFLWHNVLGTEMATEGLGHIGLTSWFPGSYCEDILVFSGCRRVIWYPRESGQKWGPQRDSASVRVKRWEAKESLGGKWPQHLTREPTLSASEGGRKRKERREDRGKEVSG